MFPPFVPPIDIKTFFPLFCKDIISFLNSSFEYLKVSYKYSFNSKFKLPLLFPESLANVIFIISCNGKISESLIGFADT